MFGRTRRRRMPSPTALALVGAGALAMYFFDPRMGRTRRAQLQGRLYGMFNRGTDRVSRRGEYLAARAEGLAQQVAHSSDEPPPTDEALADRIRSEVLTRHRYPKGNLNIMVVDGVVELRGTLDSQVDIDDIEQEVRKVTGVVDVRNLLHLPGQQPPNVPKV